MFSNLMGAGSNAPAAPNPGTQAPAPGPGQLPPTASNTGAASPNTAPNGTVPAVGTDIQQPNAATPFDQFAELWKNEPVDPNAPPPQSGVFGTIDPKRFMEAAGKIDFAKVVTPEQLQQITAGGDNAMAAFAAALNSVAQTTYAQSAFASTKIAEQAVAKAKESILADLPQHIKRNTVQDNLRQENPIFSNPAVQPIISALEQQMTVKYPQATASEITTMAKQYVEALGTSFAPKPPENKTGANGKTGREEMDWSTFLP
jgi:hypothetical protein